MNRYLKKYIERDLQKKMVFVGGPRQVGKTTLAKSFLEDNQGYLNWDISKDREKILKNEIPPAPILVFDELHKYRLWRNYIKGVFDDLGQSRQILVTGSARLDYYRRGGESLQGRYFYMRLHPLSVAELGIKTKADFSELLTLGGFPEPFFSSSKFDAKRWSLDYRERLLRDDLQGLEQVHDIGNLENLMLRLPDLVSSPLSVNNLREDLQVNHGTATRWLEILERLYAIFFLSPFGVPKLRAVKKERKHYHYDWTLIEDKGSRFENLLACHLLKWTHFLRDTEGRNLELCYFRDVYKHEVDFVVVENKKPILFVEAKWSDDEIAKGLQILKQKFPQVPSWQVSFDGKKDYVSRDGIRVCNALIFLQTLI